MLELDGVSVAYGPYEALFDVSLRVGAGRATALVGANGAGKSTVARAVSGLVPSTRGTIRFDGQDITGRPAYEIARSGLSQLTEGRSVFASLSVEENLTLSFRRALGRRGVAGALAQAYGAFPRLGERRTQSAGTLSGGEQRMLGPGRGCWCCVRSCWWSTSCRSGSPRWWSTRSTPPSSRSWPRVRSLLLIEQHVDRALALVDDVVVLAKGRVVFDGTPADVEGRLGDLVLGRTGHGVADGAPPGTTPG